MRCVMLKEHLIVSKAVVYVRQYSRRDTGKYYLQINFKNTATITVEYDLESERDADYSRLEHSVCMA